MEEDTFWLLKINEDVGLGRLKFGVIANLLTYMKKQMNCFSLPDSLFNIHHSTLKKGLRPLVLKVNS